MTIKKSKFNKEHRNVRAWAKKHQKEIYELFNNKCNHEGCKETDKNKLTIHHKEYKIGLEFVEVLCNNHHRNFHDLELQKKILILLLHDFKVNEVDNNLTVGEYKHQLWERIDKIPIKISARGVNGLDFEFDNILKDFCNESDNKINLTIEN